MAPPSTQTAMIKRPACFLRNGKRYLPITDLQTLYTIPGVRPMGTFRAFCRGELPHELDASKWSLVQLEGETEVEILSCCKVGNLFQIDLGEKHH